MFREFAEVVLTVMVLFVVGLVGIFLLANVVDGIVSARPAGAQTQTHIEPMSACEPPNFKVADERLFEVDDKRLPLDLAVVSEASSCPPNAVCLVYPVTSIRALNVGVSNGP